MHSIELRKLCDYYVDAGREKLGLSMGVVSHITDNGYELIAVSSSAGVFIPGETFPLYAPYCLDVYKKQRTIALTEIDYNPNTPKHPLYGPLPLEAYIGTPIFYGKSAWGTLNFSCMKPRAKPFTEGDIQFIEAVAADISNALSSHDL